MVQTEPDGGRKWLMAYAPIGAKGIYIYIYIYIYILISRKDFTAMHKYEEDHLS